MFRSRLPKFAISATALVAIPLGVTFAHGGRASTSPESPTGTKNALAGGARAGENASAVVAAANAFLTMLTPEQRRKVQIERTKAAAGKWTNFPVSATNRNGVLFKSLTPEQLEAALKVARLALGAEGFGRLQELRAADDVLAKAESTGGRRGPGGGRGGPGGPGGPPPGGDGGPPPDQNDGGPGRGPDGPGEPIGDGPGGGGPGGGPGGYGAGNYLIAFLGAPSATEPWILQIGGHHLAFNVAYKGGTSSATPYFVGTEPQKWTASGVTHEPLAPMRATMFGLANSLTAEQRTKAKLAARFSDVYVGPGRDGKFPKQEGIPVAELSAASQAFVKKAIAAWTGDAARAAEYQRLYESELDRTTVGLSGATTFKSQGDYVRIDGPHVWIEFVCQNWIVFPDQIHFHTIWRDRVADYGASFDF